MLGSQEPYLAPVFKEALMQFARHWWVVLLSLFLVSYMSVLFRHRFFVSIRRFSSAFHALRSGEMMVFVSVR